MRATIALLATCLLCGLLSSCKSVSKEELIGTYTGYLVSDEGAGSVDPLHGLTVMMMNGRAVGTLYLASQSRFRFVSGHSVSEGYWSLVRGRVVLTRTSVEEKDGGDAVLLMFDRDSDVADLKLSRDGSLSVSTHLPLEDRKDFHYDYEFRRVSLHPGNMDRPDFED